MSKYVYHNYDIFLSIELFLYYSWKGKYILEQEIYNCKLRLISYFLIYVIINTYISIGIVQSTLTFVMQIILSLFYIINVFEQFFVYFQVITNKLCEKYIKGAHHKSYPPPPFYLWFPCFG